MYGCFLYQHFSVTLHHSKKIVASQEGMKGRDKEETIKKKRRKEKRGKRKKAKRGNKEEKTLYKNPTLK